MKICFWCTELLEYIPDLKEDVVLAGIYLWIVLNILKPDGWKSILENARKAWTHQSYEDKTN